MTARILLIQEETRGHRPRLQALLGQALKPAPCILILNAETATIWQVGSPVDRRRLGPRGRAVVRIAGLLYCPVNPNSQRGRAIEPESLQGRVPQELP